MTTAQLLKIHHDMEQRNRQREREYNKPIISKAVTDDRKTFRQFLKTRTA